MKLNREFYVREGIYVLFQLIGKVLHIKKEDRWYRYRIVEAELYDGRCDKASHAYPFKRTRRTEAMFMAGGHLYIYLIYGMYYCMNIVLNEADIPQAALIRAVEPLDESVRAKRDIKTNGPGKLCRHLGIDHSFYGEDLTQSHRIFLSDDGYIPKGIIATPRINIPYAEEAQHFLWRFIEKDNPFVSQSIKKDVTWIEL